jgi:hypothetical protein
VKFDFVSKGIRRIKFPSAMAVRLKAYGFLSVI